jgi:hypothetical protein
MGPGGFLVALCDGSLSIGASIIKDFFVLVQFYMMSGQFWWFTGVYGPHQDILEQAFLHELREVRNRCGGPWTIAGDFSMIYRSEDKNNSNINQTLLGSFRNSINSLDLKEIEIRLEGGEYAKPEIYKR